MSFDFKKELDRCTRCGKCRSVCPVFDVTLNEADVARGRLFLAGTLDRAPSKGYLEALSKCLLCGACANLCPASVPVTDLTRAARSHHRVHAIKRYAHKNILPDAKKMKHLSRAGKVAQRLGAKTIPDGSGLYLRFGVDRLLGNRRFPAFPEEDFLTTHGTRKKENDIAIFTGCTANYLMPKIGEAALDVLKQIDMAADVPADQACCGLMAYGAGDDDAAKACASKFVQIFAGYKTILSLCASCTTMLKKHLPEVLPESAEFADRVVDIHSFLLNLDMQLETKIDAERLPIAYHAPCHYRFAQKEDAPLRLIRSIKGIELAELEDHCCGFGGSYSLANPKISAAVSAIRAGQIEISRAKTVVTSCAGCLLGIYDGVKEIKPMPEVLHPLELIASLLEKGQLR